MGKNKNFGFQKLIRNSLAVLTASLSALIGNQSKASPFSIKIDNGNEDLNYENFQNKVLKSKLILKLNVNSPHDSFLTNHASHSSHASHASHSSHSSHISSSPTYSPSSTVPVYIPSTPAYTPSNNNQSDNAPIDTNKVDLDTSILTNYVLGSRILYKGCAGTDVKELQSLLIQIGYNVLVTGYFEEKTDMVVREFQTSNRLKIDGKVGVTTLSYLRKKL